VIFKRQLSVLVVLGAGSGLIGCQSPLSGLAFWNKSSNRSIASASPDVGRQQYDGLSQQFAGGSNGAAGLGGRKPAEPTGLTGMWKKSTAGVSGMFAAKPKPESDATRLDAPSRKVGPEVYVAAARLLENQDKFGEAQQQYEKALKASPNDLNTLVGLARLHDRQGESAKALGFYQRAVKAHGNNALVHNDLGLCYARQKQLDKSIQSLGKAVELQPENARYRNNLATVLVEAGYTREALAQLSQAGSEAVAHYNVGYLLHKRGQQGEAVQHLQQAIALDPDLTPAREMLATWGAASGAEQTGSARFASKPNYERPTFDAANSYRVGIPAAPISIQMPSRRDDAGGYSVEDQNADESGVQTTISDGPAMRLPPLDE
jgi:tetratricopeptide (TPR) repeat protein